MPVAGVLACVSLQVPFKVLWLRAYLISLFFQGNCVVPRAVPADTFGLSQVEEGHRPNVLPLEWKPSVF